MRCTRGPEESRLSSPRHRVWAKAFPTAVLAALVLLPSIGVAKELQWCHRVRRGDSLSTLARHYRTSVRNLARLNALNKESVLRVGTTLKLPTFLHLRRGKLKLAPRRLVAKAGNLGRENSQADRQNLSRMRDLRMVRRFVRAGLLARVPQETSTYWVSGVPSGLRVARPWTKRFIEQLTRGFHGIYGKRLKVTSLTRTVKVQRKLRAWNGNAAPARGGNRSTHLTGASVDISKQPLSRREVRWLRQVLRRLSRQRVIHAIEEFQHPHFHVMVFKRYQSYARRLASPVLIGGC